MNENNSVLIGVRCDTALVQEVDRLAKLNGYETRSTFVRKLIIDAVNKKVETA